MKPKYVLTITAEMVARPRDIGPHTYFKLMECMGRLQVIDIGKRVYDMGGFYQVENDEQRDARIKRDGGDKPVWTTPTYPGDGVRVQLLCTGKPISDVGDVRIMDYYDLANPAHPLTKHKYYVASFCPGETTCFPGDSPKTAPEHGEWVATAAEADALFDRMVAERKADGWRDYDRQRGDNQ